MTIPARWESVAERLENPATDCTVAQKETAASLGLNMPPGLPAPVAAVVIRHHLSEVLMESTGSEAGVPDSLKELELDLDIRDHAQLITNSRQEVSAWFAARYMQLTARGLRDLRPKTGDVVVRGDNQSQKMIISSIDDSGRIHMRGGRGKRAWPNYLKLIARDGVSGDYEVHAKEVDAAIRNSKTQYSPSSPKLDRLKSYRVTSRVPSVDAIRELEDLLESGEPNEAPFQKLVERHMELLALLVTGNWITYVLPQQRLGAEYVTDFLVLGVNSLGPQWVAVELEAPRHEILTQAGDLRAAVQHAVTQIQDWRDWLTDNVSYAQSELGLHGITNKVQGLVIIGREDPQNDRQPARSRVSEQQNIQIHSWDWLLRQAKQVADRRLLAAEYEMSALDEEIR